jgi:hypothetical protein
VRRWPMRRDVLEHMADEIGAHQADPLASFTTWDEGRRNLDGMSRGKRWDIDREQREWEKANEAELAKYAARHRWSKFEKAHPERVTAAQRAWVKENRAHLRAYRKRYQEEHAEKERLWRKRQRANQKADPKRWALRQASFDRHKSKKNARAKERYRLDIEASRAKARASSARYYAKRPREGKRRCSVCHQLGHNVRRCPTVPRPSPPAPRAPAPAAP